MSTEFWRGALTGGSRYEEVGEGPIEVSSSPETAVHQALINGLTAFSNHPDSELKRDTERTKALVDILSRPLSSWYKEWPKQATAFKQWRFDTTCSQAQHRLKAQARKTDSKSHARILGETVATASELYKARNDLLLSKDLNKDTALHWMDTATTATVNGARFEGPDGPLSWDKMDKSEQRKGLLKMGEELSNAEGTVKGSVGNLLMLSLLSAFSEQWDQDTESDAMSHSDEESEQLEAVAHDSDEGGNDEEERPSSSKRKRRRVTREDLSSIEAQSDHVSM